MRCELFSVVYQPSAVGNAIKEPTDTTGDLKVEMEMEAALHLLFAIRLSNTVGVDSTIVCLPRPS